MASCHDVHEDAAVYHKTNKILLMGNPNVGKSVFFSQLTGLQVMSSNYAGTTVTYTEGTMELGGRRYTLIDVPGTYSLDAVSEAEAVAVRFMESSPLAVVCVLDSTNLERNIKLGLELQRFNVPIIYALNLVDVAQRHGLQIDAVQLAQELGAPVVPTVAVKGEGFDRLRQELEKVVSQPGFKPNFPAQIGDQWQLAKQIAARVRNSVSGELSFFDRLGSAVLQPWPGIPIALAVTLASLGVIVQGGKTLEGILLILVENALVPFFATLFSSFIPEGVLLNVLIGEYGIFVISFEWIVALILPYVFMFYVVFSFL